MSVVTIEKRGEVARVMMNDGKANVLNPTMLSALDEALTECQDARAVILTGSEKVFCGGLDLKLLPTLGRAELAQALGQFAELCLRLLQFPRPVVAAAGGHAVAGGAVLLLCCDYRMGVNRECKVGLNEVAIGVPMPTFVIELARQVMPSQRLRPAVLHGRLYDAPGALSAGFLDELVETDQLTELGWAKGEELSRLPEPAYSMTKARLWGGLTGSLEGLAQELAVFFTEQAKQHASQFR